MPIALGEHVFLVRGWLALSNNRFRDELSELREDVL
jgi:hypothetical protein